MPPIDGDYGYAAHEDAPLLMKIERASQDFPYQQTVDTDRSLAGVYMRTAKACSTSPAIMWPENGVTLTYSELLQESTLLSNAIMSHTAPLRRRIALFLPQSIFQIFSVLATLQATCAYIPICASTPAKRVAHILSDCKPDCIITVDALKDALAEVLPNCETHTWAPSLDKLASSGDLKLLVPATQPVAPEEDTEQMGAHVAYILYTSGTTGLPKGCVVSHENVLSYIDSGIKKWYTPSHNDRVLFSANYAFDTSVEIMWTCWASGAALVGASKDIAVDAREAMPQFMSDQGITIWSGTPTQLRDLTDAQEKLSALRLAIVGGEVCGQDVANAWGGKVLLLNTYGPTECTVIVTAARVVPNEKVPIGAVFPALGYHIVNDQMLDVPEGEKGELLITGSQVCLGYLNRPDITSAKFINHPIDAVGTERQRRAYRTGDLVSVGVNGSLNFHGRIDGMVKIAGQRIELGEIETSLLNMEDITSAVVVAQKKNDTDTPVLVAFIEFKQGQKLSAPDRSASTLRKLMRKTLPSYMIPQYFVLLPAKEVPRAAISQKTLVAQMPKFWEIPKTQMVPATAPGVATEEEEYGSPLEKKLCEVLGSALGMEQPLPPELNFFEEGGNSSFAGTAISAIRRETCLSHVTIRDLYKNPTARSLATVKPARTLNTETAQLMRESLSSKAPEQDEDQECTGLLDGKTSKSGVARPSTGLFMLAQAAFIMSRAYIGALALYFSIYYFGVSVAPIIWSFFDSTTTLLLSPVLAFTLGLMMLPLSVLWYRTQKFILLGEIRPESFRHRSYTNFLHWCLLKEQQVIVKYSKALFGGTEFHNSTLRALGATIGKGVYMHNSSKINGPLELVHIGDNVSMHIDSMVQTMEYQDGIYTLNKVFVGARTTMGLGSVVNQGGQIAQDSYLAARSYVLPGQRVPSGEVWSGSPAQFNQQHIESHEAPVDTDLGPFGYAMFTVIFRVLVLDILAAPVLLAVNHVITLISPDQNAVSAATQMPFWMLGVSVITAVIAVCAAPFAAALFMRMLPKVRPGVYHTWGITNFVIQTKMDTIRGVGEFWSATMYFPGWLWLCGANIGSDCEFDNLDMVPELVTTGDEIFCADPIHLGPPLVSNGRVMAKETTLGSKVFTGNGAYVVPGSTLPGNVLIGVGTTLCTHSSSPEVQTPGVEAGTSWMGLPAYPMQRPTQGNIEETQLRPPCYLRAARFFWEYIVRPWIVAVPVFAGCLVIHAFPYAAGAAGRGTDDLFMGVFIFPALLGVCALLPPCSVIATKWILLGTVKAGEYPLYSEFVNKWSCQYTHDRTQQQAGCVSAFEGTDFYTHWLRCMGAEIGDEAMVKQLVTHDHDMYHLGNGAYTQGPVQAHTFEERVLKMGHIHIGHGAQLSDHAMQLLGSTIEDGAHVVPCSVVHKNEKLAAHRGHVGNPTTCHEAAAQAPIRLPPGAKDPNLNWAMANIV